MARQRHFLVASDLTRSRAVLWSSLTLILPLALAGTVRAQPEAVKTKSGNEKASSPKPGHSLIFDLRTRNWGSNGMRGFEEETIEEIRAAPGEHIGHKSIYRRTPPFTLLKIVDKDHARVRIADDLWREEDEPRKEQTKDVVLAAGKTLRANTRSSDGGTKYTLRISDLTTLSPVTADSPEVVAALGKYAEIVKDERGTIQFVGPPGAGHYGKTIEKAQLERWQNLDAAFWQNLSKLNNLRGLSLVGTNLADGDLKALVRFPRLVNLDLSETKVTDADLVRLEGLKRLEELNLGTTNITDVGIKHVAGLQRLERLNLSNTAVSDECVKSLHKKLPNCEFVGPKMD
jgi:hypothetical protein